MKNISRESVKKFWPLAVFALGIGLFFAFGLNRYVSFQALKDNRQVLLSFVAAQPVGAVLVYMAIYALSTALSLPGGLVMTVTGGFLFGPLTGTLATVSAATIGGCIIFLAARYALVDLLRARAGPWLAKMESGFRANAMSYLLVLRLVPLFPFFIVNLAPAFLGVSFRTYAIGTFFGIIPGTLVYTLAGSALGSVFDAGGEFSADGLLLHPPVLAAFTGLVALALIPVLYRRFTSGAQS